MPPPKAAAGAKFADWAEFDRDNYLEVTIALARKVAEHTDAYVGAARPGAPPPSNAVLAEPFRRLMGMIDSFAHYKGAMPPEARAEILGPFFPRGSVVPETDPACELVTDVFLILFKELYPTLRKIIIAYAMPALRREWGAFHPLLVPNGSPNLELSGRVPDRPEMAILPHKLVCFDAKFDDVLFGSKIEAGIFLGVVSATDASPLLSSMHMD